MRAEEPDRRPDDHASVEALGRILGVACLHERVAYDRRGAAIALYLSGLGLQALPAEIGQLSQLQTLYLRDN
jgi:hypothetical protein